jgi:hypothetical protein
MEINLNIRIVKICDFYNQKFILCRTANLKILLHLVLPNNMEISYIHISLIFEI